MPSAAASNHQSRLFPDPSCFACAWETLPGALRPQLAVRRYQTIRTGTCLIAIPSGTVYVVTDNDGVDDSPGETQFLNLGKALD
jgi:hypothetical protein